jgi:hypothetical protein
MGESNYRKLASSRKINVIRKAHGLGCYALVEYSSLPDRFRQKIRKKYPLESVNQILRKWFEDNYAFDDRAREAYSRFRFETGRELPTAAQREYTINASVAGAIISLFNNKKILKRSMGGKVNWEEMSDATNYYREAYGHTLPTHPARLKEKIREFQRGGYEVFISGKFLNQNTRKVSFQTERLILSIAAQPTNPFNNTIHEIFTRFVEGEIDICDPLTGEVFNRADFCDKSGNAIQIGESTIWNYINSPRNKILLGKMRNTPFDFNNAYAPHHHRHSPEFSFSKVSMDDRDLPRRLAEGQRVKAYYAYDVASGCVIGYAYNRKKKEELFTGCLRSMFRLIAWRGWNIPAEVEVEHHLVSKFKDSLMKAGEIFPFVRFCNPGNSQEKRAEHFNRDKKYRVEKKNHVGIGRWWLRMEVNRIKAEKVYDQDNDTYRYPVYDYDELVADDLADILQYNNMLHPNQKRYPGMSRWQVLCENMNPNLHGYDRAKLCRYIGEHTQTSIRRTQYFALQGMKFSLSCPQIIKKLGSNDYKVDAYYLPELDGSIKEVYIYQSDVLVDVCKPVLSYNEATCEQMQQDKEAYLEQAKYVSRFRKMVGDDKIEEILIVSKKEKETIKDAIKTAKEVSPALLPEEEDYSLLWNKETAYAHANDSL